MTPVVRGRHWLVALVFAAAVHLGLFIFLVEPPPSGAVAWGEGGLDIALGPSGGAPGAVAATAESDTLEAAEPETFEAAEVEADSLAETEPEQADPLVDPVSPEEVVADRVETQEAPLEPDVAEPLIEQLAEAVQEPEAGPDQTEVLEMSEAEPTPMTEPEEAVVAEMPEDPPPPAPAAPPPPKPYREPPPQQMAARPAPPPPPPAASSPAPSPPPSAAPPVASQEAPAGSGGIAGADSSDQAVSGRDASAGGNPGAERDYFAQLLAWLERHKEYPRQARARRREGTAMLWVEIDRQGRVLAYNLQKSAGDSSLDGAVEQMIQRAQPLPPLPPDMPQQRLSFVVPVEFQLR